MSSEGQMHPRTSSERAHQSGHTPASSSDAREPGESCGRADALSARSGGTDTIRRAEARVSIPAVSSARRGRGQDRERAVPLSLQPSPTTRGVPTLHDHGCPTRSPDRTGIALPPRLRRETAQHPGVLPAETACGFCNARNLDSDTGSGRRPADSPRTGRDGVASRVTPFAGRALLALPAP